MRTVMTTVERAGLRAQVNSQGLRALARAAGVSTRTVKNAISGGSVAETTIRKLARIAPRVRTAEEFKGIDATAKAPIRQQGAYSWSLETIRQARDCQLRGQFASPVRLAESVRTDDALFVAYHARIAPLASLGTRLVAHPSARGEAVAKVARESVRISRPTQQGLVGTLANHGLAIGHITRETKEEGTRVDFLIEEWPLEFVRWDEVRGCLVTRTQNDPQEREIRHGDSEWIVFRKFRERPWTQEACVLPAALVWAAHAEGLGDWASTTHAHGLAKLVGELPEGVALTDESGALTAQAQAFLAILRDLVTGDAVAGIRPAGAKTDWASNGSGAWEVFDRFMANREKAAARIYTGTDAILGSVGGAPGVDISELFGVSTTKVQGDVTALESGLNTGAYEPWCALNYGDSRLAPHIEYQLPDPDADAKREQRAKNWERLILTIKGMREQKLVVDQAVVERVSVEFGVEPAPTLADIEQQTSTLMLAPTDVAKVVRAREARASQGLPPFGDERDDMTLSELEVWTQAKLERLKSSLAPAEGAP